MQKNLSRILALTYVESLGTHDICKESFVKFGPANQESIGDIRRVSNWVFSVSSYILVLAPIDLGTTNWCQQIGGSPLTSYTLRCGMRNHCIALFPHNLLSHSIHHVISNGRVRHVEVKYLMNVVTTSQSEISTVTRNFQIRTLFTVFLCKHRQKRRTYVYQRLHSSSPLFSVYFFPLS